MIRKILWILLLLLIAFTAFANGFPEDLNFSLPGESAELITTENSGVQDYWYHDLSLKILFVAIFSTAGLLITWTKRHAFRKPVLIITTVVQGFLLGGYLCPSRAIQNVILKYDTAYLIMFLVPIVITLFFGRIYCGYACPFGALQELLHVKKLRYKLPEKLDKSLRYLKYILMIAAVAITIITGKLIGESAPFKPLFVFSGTLIAIMITVVFAILSVFLFRPFCTYLCPYGALMAIVSKFRLVKINKDESCASCNLCVKKCPTGAMGEPGKINGECIMCGECCDSCPKDSFVYNVGGAGK